MARPIFEGSGVAVVTPFTSTGVDYAKLEKLVEFHIKNKTDAIVICGSTGEAATMTDAEHEAAIKCAIDTVAGRVPVIAGTGSNDTAYCVDLSKRAEKLGADALLVVTPYYNKCTQEGLFLHYKAIADAVNIPVIMYNVPSRTGVNIAPATQARIVKEVPNVVGVKEASGNISQIVELMALTDGNIELYSGNDDQVVPLLSMGGLGVISVVANIAPQAMHDMCAKFFEGDLAGAQKLQRDTFEIFKYLFCEVNPIPVKKAVDLMGLNAGPLRMPLTEMTPANAEKLAQAMKNFGLI